MTTTGRIRRSMLGAGALIMALGVSGIAPKIAAAETTARTAPYDFGLRCANAYLTPILYNTQSCVEDPSALMTGVIASVGHARCVYSPLLTLARPRHGTLACAGVGSASSVGVFVNVAAPGTLSVAAEAAASLGACISIQRVTSPASYLGVSCGVHPGPVSPQLEVAVPTAGQYRVSVFPYSGVGAAIVKMITHEVTSS